MKNLDTVRTSPLSDMKGSSSRNSLVVPIILIAIALTGMVASEFLSGHPSLSISTTVNKLIFPLLRLFLYLALGLLFGEFLETLGWTARLASCLRPLTKWAHLKDESGAAFITSFVSGIGANTLLMTFYQEGKISRKEVKLTYLLNNGLPLFLLHLPTTFFITASLAGAAGTIYLSVTLIAALLRSLVILGYCRLTLPAACWLWSPIVDESDARKQSRFSLILKKFKERFYRVVLYTTPIYIIIFLLNQWGLFKWLRTGFSSWLTGGFFPVEAAGMVIFSLAAEFGAGMATAGALLQHGELSTKQAALALVVGTIIATPVRAIRHQLATQIGLFSVKLGTQLIILGQSLRVASLIFVAGIYALFF